MVQLLFCLRCWVIQSHKIPFELALMVLYIDHMAQGSWVQSFHRKRLYISACNYKIFIGFGSYADARCGHRYKPANAVG